MEKMEKSTEEKQDESPIPLVVVNEDPITIANLTEDIVQEAFETVDCLDKWAKSAKKAALFVTFAGFFSNIITKGVMKAIGFIFKAIMEHVEGISPTMAVLFPATMHLFFNTFSPLISIIERKLTYFWTFLLGTACLFFALFSMAYIPDDDTTKATIGLTLCGPILGIGCALNYHTGVQMLNLVVGSKKNAVWNGISLAGNTLGAIAVFHLMGNAFKTLHYADSLFYLAFGVTGALTIFTLMYLIPQRYVTKHMQGAEKARLEKRSEKWHQTILDQDEFRNASYYLLIISQCLNAIGFLNLTTFLNVHLEQTMGYDNTKTALVLTVMQICDCAGRFCLTFLADKLKNYCEHSIHIFYIIGTLGNGACMVYLRYVTTENGVYGICALMGLFASCFIALWNSLVKAETKNHKGFTVVYSHSLFVSGIVQLVATLAMMYLTDSETKARNYGDLMSVFGATLMSAAIPVVFIILINLSHKRKEAKPLETGA